MTQLYINAQEKYSTKTLLHDLVLITGLCIFLFGFMLGTRPLSAPDEGRYTEIPREMVVSKDYVTPRLNGVKYFEKPPLMYWLGAASIKVFGVNTWAMRFWPAFFGLITVLSVYGMGLILKNRMAGLKGATLLATCLLFYAHTRIVILDMAVTTFLSLGLFSFLLSTQKTLSPKQRFMALMGFFISASGAVMSKGLMGIVLPGGVILVACAVTKNWKALASAFHPLGLLLFLGLTLPWHVMAYLKNPEFFDFYIIHEHFTRYLDTVHNRHKPVWFFIPLILIGFFPWTVVVMKALLHAFKKNVRDQNHVFLGAWAAFIFIFFSLSNSKLIPYILPVFPPLALLTGLYLGNDQKNSVLISSKLLGVFCFLLIMALPLAAYYYNLIHIKDIVMAMAGLMIVLVFIAFIAFKNKHPNGFWSLAGCSCVFLMVLNSVWPHLDTRTVKTLAMDILKHQQKGEGVVAFDRYYQDLPPYINQTIYVVNWRGELDFGMTQEDTSSWMLEEKNFYALASYKKLYIVTRKESVSYLKEKLPHFVVMKESLHDVLGVSTP